MIISNHCLFETNLKHPLTHNCDLLTYPLKVYLYFGNMIKNYMKLYYRIHLILKKIAFKLLKGIETLRRY